MGYGLIKREGVLVLTSPGVIWAVTKTHAEKVKIGPSMPKSSSAIPVGDGRYEVKNNLLTTHTEQVGMRFP